MDSNETLKNILESVLPEYEPSSKMVTRDQCYFRGQADGRGEDYHVQKEVGKLYKSIDKFGNIYTITNPITWPIKDNTRYRHKETLVMSSAEARKSVAGRAKEEVKQVRKSEEW